MNIENLSTLKIHKLTQEQYDRERDANRLDENALYLTPYEETDPTVPAWAKAETKPTYNKSEIGLNNVDNVKQYSVENPPIVAQTEAPEDTNVLWLDTDDNTNDMSSLDTTLTVRGKAADAKAVGDQLDQLFDAIANININRDSIIEEVIAALGTPVFGRVDAENNIILTGQLIDGVYTLKYEDAEGNVTEIGTLNNVPEPTYTNILPLAINSDKTPYVGTNGEKGYKTGYRLNSSGAETAITGWEVTGCIPINSTSDVLYFKNIQRIGESSAKYDYITLLNSNFSVLTSTQLSSLETNTDMTSRGFTFDGNGDIVSIDLKILGTYGYGSVPVSNWQNVKYIRFSCYGITDESIITKNEPIE